MVAVVSPFEVECVVTKSFGAETFLPLVAAEKARIGMSSPTQVRHTDEGATQSPETPVPPPSTSLKTDGVYDDSVRGP